MAIPDLYFTLFNSEHTAYSKYEVPSILGILQEKYCQQERTKYDLFVLNHGLAKFLINTRDVTIDPFLTLEQEYSSLFKTIDSTFYDTMQSLDTFENQYFMVSNMAKANILNQKLYGELGRSMGKQIYKIKMFNSIRLFNLMGKCKKFCEAD